MQLQRKESNYSRHAVQLQPHIRLFSHCYIRLAGATLNVCLRFSVTHLLVIRLIAIKGIGSRYIERIEFIWSLTSPAKVKVPIAPSWTCLTPSDPIAIRAEPTAQCMSADGTTCLQQSMLGCWHLRMCGEQFSKTPVTCSPGDGTQDPTHWCSRARGALGE